MDTEVAQNNTLSKKTVLSQSYFNPVSLFFYDFTLFNGISPYLWGCSAQSLIDRYQKYCGKKHLEVGVGTGYLLDHYLAKVDSQALDLSFMDLSEACLNKSCQRLKRFSPILYRRNILEPINGVEERFDSISLNYVMHCVAGNFSEKGIAFKHLKPLLKEEGILFGVSVLKTDKSTILAKAFMGFLNKIGVFNNLEDRVRDLEFELNKSYNYVKVQLASSAIMFMATDSEEIFNRQQMDTE